MTGVFESKHGKQQKNKIKQTQVYFDVQYNFQMILNGVISFFFFRRHAVTIPETNSSHGWLVFPVFLSFPVGTLGLFSGPLTVIGFRECISHPLTASPLAKGLLKSSRAKTPWVKRGYRWLQTKNGVQLF